MELEEAIKKRTATRKFDKRQIEKEKLDRILNIARLAPSAKNIQPIKIYVVQSENGINKIDKTTKCRYGAPTVLIICGDKEEAYHKDNYSTYEMDCSILATHIMLESANIDVDSIWIESFDQKMIKKEFEIEDKYTPVCLIPLGYKAKDCPVNPMHTKRKTISELVEYK